MADLFQSHYFRENISNLIQIFLKFIPVYPFWYVIIGLGKGLAPKCLGAKPLPKPMTMKIPNAEVCSIYISWTHQIIFFTVNFPEYIVKSLPP